MLEYVSRWMFVFHSQLVVSGCPVPMYLAWRRSSSCCDRSLSACRGCQLLDPDGKCIWKKAQAGLGCQTYHISLLWASGMKPGSCFDEMDEIHGPKREKCVEPLCLGEPKSRRPGTYQVRKWGCSESSISTNTSR